jgi:hypothetical protein
MVIERHKRNSYLGKKDVYPMRVGQSVLSSDLQPLYVIHTPNLVEHVIYDADGSRKGSIFYEKEAINANSFGERLGVTAFGREDKLVWHKGSAEEDSQWASVEGKILKHEWVGHEMVMWLGKRISGIHAHLLEQEYRIEKSRSKRGWSYVTTNFEWRKVEVIDGRKSNVYGVKTGEQLKVRVMDGPDEGNIS